MLMTRECLQQVPIAKCGYGGLRAPQKPVPVWFPERRSGCRNRPRNQAMQSTRRANIKRFALDRLPCFDPDA